MAIGHTNGEPEHKVLDGFDGFQDTWVLIFVAVGWFLVAIPYLVCTCLRNRQHSSLNHAGILVPARAKRGLTKRWDRASTVVANISEITGKNKYEEIFEFVPLPRATSMESLEEDRLNGESGGPDTCQGRSLKRQYRVRTFSGFCDGKAPPPPGTSFQEGYRTSSRAMVYSKLLRGALPKCFSFLTLVGLLAMTLSWMLRNDLGRMTQWSFFSRASIEGNMLAAHEVQKVLLPLASFLLALYINMKLSWFMSIMDMSWAIQGHLHNLALMLGSILHPHDCPGHMRTKFTMYRYLCLYHLLLYRTVAIEYSRVTLDDLFGCGLIVGEELLSLADSRNPRNLVLLWCGSLLQQLSNEDKISARTRERLMDSVIALRGSGDTLVKELTRMSPISFAQLLQLVVDILLLLTPASLSHALRTDRKGVSVYLWPAFGSMVTSLFYQGGMRLITAMEYPFGLDLDDLRPKWLLMASECEIFAYLTATGPPVAEAETLVPEDVEETSESDAHAGASASSWTMTPQVVSVLPCSPTDTGLFSP